MERKYRQQLSEVQIVGKLDVDRSSISPECSAPSSSFRNSPSTYIQLLFYNVSDLLDVRKDVFEYLKTNSTNTLCIALLLTVMRSHGGRRVLRV